MRSLSNPVSRSICDAAAAAMADERYCTRSVLPAGMMGWKRYVGMKERRGGERERESIGCWMRSSPSPHCARIEQRGGGPRWFK